MHPLHTFVGRRGELRILHAALARAAEGHGGSVLIEGEPGGGKTRLIEEFARRAAGRATRLVHGRCVNSEGAPSMWPWTQIVGGLVDALPVEEQPGWRSGRIAVLLRPHDDPSGGSAQATDDNRFRLFEEIVALIRRVCACQAVVLLIDDLHWADAASLDLLAHLIGNPSPALVVGAFRDHAPSPSADLAHVLGIAGRAVGHRRLAVGHRRLAVSRFSAGEVDQLVASEFGSRLGTADARAIFARTNGNPFFVQELARLLAESPTITSAATAEVPATVRDVVRDRMAGLRTVERQVLELASILGRQGRLSLLARAAGLANGPCLELLEPAAELGLIELTVDPLHSFSFVHDLVRESIAAILSPHRAAQLHLRIADALEGPGSDIESAPEQVAHHLWCAGVLADPQRTATAMIRAARRHVAKYAFPAADRQLRLAIQIARNEGLFEVELAALSALLAVGGMRSMYADVQASLLERAEDLARGLGKETEATTFLYLRWASLQQGARLDQAGPLAHRLLMQGEASTHLVARAYGLAAWATHQWNVGSIDEAFSRLSKSEQILIGRTGGHDDNPIRYDLRMLITGLFAEITALRGDLDGARALLTRLEMAGRDSYSVTVWASMSTRVAVLAGDPAWAARAAQRGICVDPDFTYVFLGTYQRLALSWAEALRGESPAEAARAAERLIESNLLNPVRSGAGLWHGLLAEMQLASGSTERALHSLDRAERLMPTTGQRNAEPLITLVRARVMRARGEPVAAVRTTAESAARCARVRGSCSGAYPRSSRRSMWVNRPEPADRPGLGGAVDQRRPGAYRSGPSWLPRNQPSTSSATSLQPASIVSE